MTQTQDIIGIVLQSPFNRDNNFHDSSSCNCRSYV